MMASNNSHVTNLSKFLCACEGIMGGKIIRSLQSNIAEVISLNVIFQRKYIEDTFDLRGRSDEFIFGQGHYNPKDDSYIFQLRYRNYSSKVYTIRVNFLDLIM